MDDLQAQLDKANAENADLRAELVSKSQDIDTLTLARDDATGKLDKANADFEEVAKQRDQLTHDLAAARKEPAVTRAPRAPKLRSVGPMPDKAPVLSAKDLLDRLRDAPHTIVFSDGKSEIAALDPVVASADAWAAGPAGVVLTAPVSVKADRQITLAGFGLLDPDGKQIAWCPLATPVQMGPGTDVKLDRQIFF